MKRCAARAALVVRGNNIFCAKTQKERGMVALKTKRGVLLCR